jgi:DNA gyrase/topoisomerase IV subunit A
MDEEEFELIVSEMPNTNDKTKLLKKLLTAVKEKKRKQIIHELSLDPE